jgi:chromate transporter
VSEAAPAADVVATSDTQAAVPVTAAHGVSFSEAFGVWLRVAALSFGGPAGQIAVMHRIIVDEKRWVGEARFLHALSYCTLLPGPEAQQLATYIGWLMHRTRGGVMAGTLFVLPGVLAIMALSYVYAGWGQIGAVAAPFFGLKSAVLAVVLQAVFRIGSRALTNRVLIGMAALAFIAIFFFGVPFPIIIIGAGIIGWFGTRSGSPLFQAGGHGYGNAKGVADADSLLGVELPTPARPTARGQCAPHPSGSRSGSFRSPSCSRRSAQRTPSARSLSSSAKWLSLHLAAPTPCLPTSPNRRSSTTTGSAPARCWMASAWRKRHRGH